LHECPRASGASAMSRTSPWKTRSVGSENCSSVSARGRGKLSQRCPLVRFLGLRPRRLQPT